MPDRVLRPAERRPSDGHQGRQRAEHDAARVPLVPAKELGAVKVGDEVEVLETGEHWFIAGGVEREEQDRLYYALKEKGRKGAG
ncbi:hypothetical protein LTR16_012054 [Cryomyces antarcticus]|uniref:SH3 domain-containing protein n=1 Tax=Cryomyces antarcticus TaxID=329879 RepID=A0ABR0IT96_9PEZI|nr:hypothetical protein LTR16_012054 [Cryomyces antarcticus]